MSAIRHPAAALLLAALVACGGRNTSDPRPITKERRWQPVGALPIPGVSSAERFGFEQRPPIASSDSPELVWNTPRGWRALPPTSMRVANFQVAGDERAECYLSIMSGDGGGLSANVNRWRKQMSLPPIDEAALAAAPRAPLLGGEALQIDLTGTWVGMDGTQSSANWRMVGLIAVDAAGARFLKMTGPADVIEPEIEAFQQLAASLRVGESDEEHDGATPGIAESSANLTWRVPEGWQRAEDRPMREVTFRVGADGAGECYVTLLGGTAGGAFANVNRWRDQMGQPQMSSDEFARLQRIPMLATEGVVVEVDGTYRGMGDELIEDAALLGAVCEQSGHAVFVKLVGPVELVRGARADFLAFCQSLEAGG